MKAKIDEIFITINDLSIESKEIEIFVDYEIFSEGEMKINYECYIGKWEEDYRLQISVQYKINNQNLPIEICIDKVTQSLVKLLTVIDTHCQIEVKH